MALLAEAATGDGDRFRHMSPTTAFPLSGRTGAHQDLVRAVCNRGWGAHAHILLNCGSLPDRDVVDVVAVADGMAPRLLVPATTVRILHLSPP